MTFLAGIDETATETALSEGWTYFILPKEYVEDFEKAADKLVSPKLKVFHGKKFKKEFKKEYTAFLRLTREYVEKCPALLAVTLNNESWKKKYVDFCYRMLEEVFKNLEIKDKDLLNTTKKFVPPLFSLQKMLNIFNLYYQIAVVIDSDDVTKKFASFTTDIKGNIFTIKNVKAEFALQKFYNSYRQLKFPRSPELVSDGIAVLKDSKSKII